jgi:hypothetical protein
MYISEETKMVEAIAGKTITSILFSEDFLTLETTEGDIHLVVEGDCCSRSYFFDFYGVVNLLRSKVIRFEPVALSPGDVGYHEETYDVSEVKDDWIGNYVQVFGYGFITEHPLFGELTSVLSFRNESNGYYGGWMTLAKRANKDRQERLTADKIG